MVCLTHSAFFVYFVNSIRKGPIKPAVFCQAAESSCDVIDAAMEVPQDTDDIPLGLIINFKELKVTDGVSRLFLTGANRG
jgi:hypothetical protein